MAPKKPRPLNFMPPLKSRPLNSGPLQIEFVNSMSEIKCKGPFVCLDSDATLTEEEGQNYKEAGLKVYALRKSDPDDEDIEDYLDKLEAYTKSKDPNYVVKGRSKPKPAAAAAKNDAAAGDRKKSLTKTTVAAKVEDEEEWHDEEIHGSFNPFDPKCQCVIS